MLKKDSLIMVYILRMEKFITDVHFENSEVYFGSNNLCCVSGDILFNHCLGIYIWGSDEIIFHFSNVIF